MKLQQRIDNLINASKDNFIKRGNHSSTLEVEQRPGRKYIKIVNRTVGLNKLGGAEAWSVWCFIDKDGNVYKPASYKAPAKHIRYCLLDDASYQEALTKADWAGSWLYL
jgi:hypothetical protein